MGKSRCGFVIIDKTGKYTIIIQENDRHKKWGIPKGHVEFFDKNKFMCAARETREELNLDIFDYDFQSLSKKGDVYLIKLNEFVDKIKIKPGREITRYHWVKIDDLKYALFLRSDKFNAFSKKAFQML